MPRALSVLHVEQEASASAVTLVEQVLAADAERARLLAEADALEAEIDREAEAGGGWDDAMWAERIAKLAALSDALAACGADDIAWAWYTVAGAAVVVGGLLLLLFVQMSRDRRSNRPA